MKLTLTSLSLLLLLLILSGCSQFDSARGKSTAQTLSGGRWVIHESEGFSSSDCGDCMADIVVRVKSLDGKKYESMCIDTTNPQFADYANLKNGDLVSFQIANNPPVQEKCGSGAFVILKKER
jgi:hypothetical protein